MSGTRFPETTRRPQTRTQPDAEGYDDRGEQSLAAVYRYLRSIAQRANGGTARGGSDSVANHTGTPGEGVRR
jgi:hypothetical protein